MPGLRQLLCSVRYRDKAHKSHSSASEIAQPREGTRQRSTGAAAAAMRVATLTKSGWTTDLAQGQDGLPRKDRPRVALSSSALQTAHVAWLPGRELSSALAAKVRLRRQWRGVFESVRRTGHRMHF